MKFIYSIAARIQTFYYTHHQTINFILCTLAVTLIVFGNASVGGVLLIVPIASTL